MILLASVVAAVAASVTPILLDPVPEAPGTYEQRAVVVDERGSWSLATVEVPVREPARPGTYVAIGDSVASGHGLDRWDYFGRDRCWRSGGAAFPAIVGELLAERGTELEVVNVACSGAFVDELWTDGVGGGPDGVVEDDRASQIDWVVALNPGLVSITIGANDLGFADPGELIGPDGEIDETVLGARLDDIERDVEAVVAHLLDTTDARIVLTNYHDPTADDPHGIPGCSRTCFSAAAETVSARFAAVYERIGAVDPSRVVVADARAAFVGHGAGNGRGIDALRLGGTVFGRLVPDTVAGVSAYCARGDHDNDTWINAVDCVHPNGEGQQAYAAAVLAALDETDWLP